MADCGTTRVGRGRRAIVVGCGPSGALMSIYLARQGWEVEMFERRPIYDKKRPDGGIVARGYDILLSRRGLEAIRAAGAELGPDIAVWLDYVILHRDKVGKNTRLPIQAETVSVNRDLLGESLRKEGMRKFPKQISYHFEHKMTGVDFEAKLVTFEKGSSIVTRPYDLLVGCDGVWSSVRAAMEREGFLTYKQNTKKGGGWVAELGSVEDMPGADASWNRSWHLWLKQKKHIFMAISPTPEGRCRLLFGTETPEKLPLMKGIDAEAEIVAWLRSTFPDFFGDRKVPEGWVKHLLEQSRLQGSAETQCSAFHAGDSVVLVGDAAHSVLPNQGQGCSAGLESCRVLADLFVAHDGNLATALPEFTFARKPDVDALAVMSRRPFINITFLVRFATLTILHKFLPFLFDEPSANKMDDPEVPYRVIASLHGWQSCQLVLLSMGMVGLTFLGMKRL